MSNENDSLLSDLTKLIPGYGAYREKESRRDDDRQTRKFLVRRLGECKSILDAIGADAVASGDLDLPAKLAKARDRIDLAQNRLSAAVEGYAGWFNERTVDASLLEKIATLDSNLVSLVDQIGAMCETFRKQTPIVFDDFNEASDLLHARIDRRSEILQRGS